VRRIAAALLPVLALAASPHASATAGEPRGWHPKMGDARAFATTRRGEVAIAVRTRDRHWSYRGTVQYRSASVVKAMLLVAYLNHGDVPRRSLRSREKAFLRPMIVRSDNGAASHTRNIVGDAGLRTLARRVRMKDFATSPSWGSTQISPYDQTRFFYRLDAFVPRRHRGYARALLSNIIGSQRWGLPLAVPNGWRVYFKGGWLPPRVVNQVGLLERGNRHIAIAVFTDGDPSFGYGQKSIQGVAQRLLLRLNDFES
jgi:hypothetical protein